MRSLIVPRPPQAVTGYPIEILEVHYDADSFLWLVKLRIIVAEKVIECFQRYDRDKRITIDTIPESDKAYRMLLAARGKDPFLGPNPLAEAIEATLRP